MPCANDGAAKVIIIPGPLAADRQIVYSNDSKETNFDYYYLWSKALGRKILLSLLLLFLDLREADRQIDFCSDEMQLYYSSAGKKI